jgi:hypothetical protein
MSVAPIARLLAAMVHSSMHVAPCQPNINIKTIDNPIETNAAAPVDEPLDEAHRVVPSRVAARIISPHVA